MTYVPGDLVLHEGPRLRKIFGDDVVPNNICVHQAQRFGTYVMCGNFMVLKRIRWSMVLFDDGLWYVLNMHVRPA